MRQHLINLSLMVLACAATGTANENFASTGYARGAAAYLAMPAHAHGAALANAVTAWNTNLAGLQCNPAVLDAADGYAIIASFALPGYDRHHGAVDAVAALGSYMVAGLSFVNAGVRGIERRDEGGVLDPANPYFSDEENAIAVSAAGRILWNISLGARARYLNQKLDTRVAHGMGFDLGATWEPDTHVCAGASVLNIGSRLWWPTGEKDEVLTQGRLGVACLLLNQQLIIEVDGVKTDYQPIEVALGIEYTFLKIISVRAGAASSLDYGTMSSRYPDISTGIGIRYSFFGFDYSMTFPTADLGLTIPRFSLILDIPK
jgi:hypothetical protein